MQPIFIEDSRVPVYLSYILPLNISAITLFPFIFASEKLTVEMKNHEMIHFQQYLETLIFGFVFLYFWDYLVGLIKGCNGEESYYKIRAEKEAYEHQEDISYLFNRKRWSWIVK